MFVEYDKCLLCPRACGVNRNTTGNDGLPPIILYDYQPSRKGTCAQNFLEGFHGLVQCDGY